MNRPLNKKLKIRAKAQNTPSADAVEANCLSCLMGASAVWGKNRDELESMINLIHPEMFSHTINKFAVKAMVDLAKKGEPLDAIKIEEWICANEDLLFPRKMILLHLSEIMTNGAVLAYFPAYVDTLRDNYARMKARHLAENLANDGPRMRREELLSTITEASYEIELWANPVVAEPTPKEDLVKFVEIIEARSKGEESTIDAYPTRFTELNENGGGWMKGSTIVVAGGTNDGKTTFALNLAEHWAVDHSMPGVVFSFEMTQDQIYSKIAAIKAKYDWVRILRGDINNKAINRISSAILKLGNIKIDKNLEVTPPDLIRRIKSYHEKLGIKWVVVDYFQNLEWENEDKKLSQMENLSRSLLKLAKKLQIVIVIVSQVNDDGLLASCRQLGKDQDDVIFIKQVKTGEGKFRDDQRIIRFRKRRGGKACFDFKLSYNGSTATYDDLEPS